METVEIGKHTKSNQQPLSLIMSLLCVDASYTWTGKIWVTFIFLKISKGQSLQSTFHNMLKLDFDFVMNLV